MKNVALHEIVRAVSPLRNDVLVLEIRGSGMLVRIKSFGEAEPRSMAYGAQIDFETGIVAELHPVPNGPYSRTTEFLTRLAEVMEEPR